MGELARRRKDAREQMELAWKDVVKANDRLRDAMLRARMRAVEAERGTWRRGQGFRLAMSGWPQQGRGP